MRLVMMKSRTVTVSIRRPAGAVYDFVSNPENFGKWLTFVTDGRREGEDWVVETAEGPMAIRFVPRNEWGVLDHRVRLADGREMVNPMRVVSNGEGCEVMFTLFQWPGMSEEGFERDGGVVERDLEKLKGVMEGGAGR